MLSERGNRVTRKKKEREYTADHARAGATAVIQPGGSLRDDEVVAAADEHGMAMVFTGIRHFRH